MSEKRKDNRGRVLHNGEIQRKRGVGVSVHCWQFSVSLQNAVFIGILELRSFVNYKELDRRVIRSVRIKTCKYG